MAAQMINDDHGKVTSTSPRRNPRRTPTPEERDAARRAELDAFAARVLATAPPPSERQLAALRRLARGTTQRSAA